ncbi:Phophatidylserine decarboxylase-domain-containing protein [Pisolithus orientalis]|uniref:Phophatidylserine decarboxylase-domain-containing protein n=1 Tax=Pisolithus orientalis TaxID=936130 RepID=UPI002224201B|nr:Phophatidylserine decarboxylase-domain-containing protein [Pisolithus orientalis]KAI5995750.1 Phophatidylserine decarboxylase-domain-containing protein [Pisolithus orientalis]
MDKANVKFDLRRLWAHYRFAPGQAHVYTVRALLPIVQEFNGYIEREAKVYDSVFSTFTPLISIQIEDYVDFLEMINTQLTAAPSYGGGASDMAAAVPYYAIISRFCNTPGGSSAFTHPGVNGGFCTVFTAWNKYLASADSTNIIHNGEGGWLSTAALNSIVQHAGGNPGQDTSDNFYICDTSDPHYGFNHGTSSSRSTVLSFSLTTQRSSTLHARPPSANLTTTSRRQTDSGLKIPPYSLNHMLAEDELVGIFVGGTLFQPMLASFDYHRWRSPVNGTVTKTRLISGLKHSNHHQPSTLDFVTVISSRALIFVQADEPVGLICFVGIGICEVSACGITVNEGQVLKKGDELGMFHFGGSTQCLVFRGGVAVSPIDQDGNDLAGSKAWVGISGFTTAMPS